MASSDEISGVAGDWSIEALELIPIEDEHAIFGRYVLCYEIAAGGMGTVYLAREQGPGGFTRAVAIKRIHPHLARKRQFVDMFLDEARVAARINHPNVCSVYGFGDVGGTHYIAMEYLVGQPLSELAPRVAERASIASSPRWHAIAARIVADACEGLHAAHELRDEAGQPLNVVHRDVSTHNVFVTYDGAVKVLDFGIARAQGRRHETRTGTVKGKLAYMSPEQARASKAIDRRSDVWSLGVVLWELLALRRLFGRRSEIELLRAVAEEPIVPPSLVRPEIPPELDAIVMRALERDVEKRYPSARALARDLGAYVMRSGEGTSLADLAELLGDLFAEEREGKLVAVAAVVHTRTSPRVVSDPKPPPPPPRAVPPPPPRAALVTEATEISSPFIETSAAPVVAPEPPPPPPSQPAAPASEPAAPASEPAAPASQPAAPASEPLMGEPPSVVVLPSAPSRKRSPMWVWVAIAAVLAVAGGVVVGIVVLSALRDPSPDVSVAATRPARSDRPLAVPAAVVEPPARETAPPEPEPNAATAQEGVLPSEESTDTPDVEEAAAETNEDDTSEDDTSEDDTSEDDTSEDDTSEDDTSEDDTSEDDTSEDDTSEDDTSEDDTSGDEASEDDTPTGHARRPTGRVNVAATGGWADIYVRGRLVARTPHVLRLPAGAQVIELRANGTGPRRRVTVHVRPGGSTRVVVPLAPMATTNPY